MLLFLLFDRNHGVYLHILPKGTKQECSAHLKDENICEKGRIKTENTIDKPLSMV